MKQTPAETYRGNDRLMFGIILGVLASWLFAQTTLNIAPTMAADLQVEQSFMNIAVSITALFSGGIRWIEGVITFVGNQENVASREAAFFALVANLLMVVAAVPQRSS